MSVVYLQFSGVLLKGNICGGGSRGDGREEVGEFQLAGCGGPQVSAWMWMNQLKAYLGLMNQPNMPLCSDSSTVHRNVESS